MISIIHNVVRYSAAMGVFSEWHPFIMRVMQYFSRQGEVGIQYLYKFVADSIADWNASSKEDRFLQEEKIEGGALLETDFLGSMLAKHRRNPEMFKVEDTNYHLLAQVGAGGETTGDEMCAAIYFLCKYPRVLEKLRVEVEGLKMRSKGARITAKDARECSYLPVCIPSVAFLSFPGLHSESQRCGRHKRILRLSPTYYSWNMAFNSRFQPF
jgi:cytochrome P450